MDQQHPNEPIGESNGQNEKSLLSRNLLDKQLANMTMIPTFPAKDLLTQTNANCQAQLNALSSKYTSLGSLNSLVNGMLNGVGNDLKLVDTDALIRKDNSEAMKLIAYSGYGAEGCKAVTEIMRSQDQTRQTCLTEHSKSLSDGFKTNQTLQTEAIHAKRDMVNNAINGAVKQNIEVIQEMGKAIEGNIKAGMQVVCGHYTEQILANRNKTSVEMLGIVSENMAHRDKLLHEQSIMQKNMALSVLSHQNVKTEVAEKFLSILDKQDQREHELSQLRIKTDALTYGCIMPEKASNKMIQSGSVLEGKIIVEELEDHQKKLEEHGDKKEGEEDMLKGDINEREKEEGEKVEKQAQK